MEQALLSQIATFLPPVDGIGKRLKTKTFIYEKSLDTPVFRLIKFRQKVLTEFIASVGTILPREEATFCRVAFSFAFNFVAFLFGFALFFIDIRYAIN